MTLDQVDESVQDSSSQSFVINLPKNLVAECYVWRQKFRLKKFVFYIFYISIIIIMMIIIIRLNTTLNSQLQTSNSQNSFKQMSYNKLINYNDSNCHINNSDSNCNVENIQQDLNKDSEGCQVECSKESYVDVYLYDKKTINHEIYGICNNNKKYLQKNDTKLKENETYSNRIILPPIVHNPKRTQSIDHWNHHNERYNKLLNVECEW